MTAVSPLSATATQYPRIAQRIATALAHHRVEMLLGQSLPSAVILSCEASGVRQIARRRNGHG